MFRLWVCEIKDSKIIKDTVVEVPGTDTRTHKIFKAIEEACVSFDLPEPLWLDANIKEFKKTGKTGFGKDNFVEELDFDRLRIEVMEEDD